MSRVVGFAKTHKSLALVDPRLTKMMEGVRTGRSSTSPKVLWLLAIAGAHLGRSRGANGGGLARRRFQGERMERVAPQSCASEQQEQPVPVRRTLRHVHEIFHSKSVPLHYVRKVLVGAVAAIKLSPSWNRSKAVQPAAGEQLEQYLPMAQWPRFPHDYLVACPEHVPGHSTTSREGTQTRPGDTLSKASCQTLLLLSGQLQT